MLWLASWAGRSLRVTLAGCEVARNVVGSWWFRRKEGRKGLTDSWEFGHGATILSDAAVLWWWVRQLCTCSISIHHDRSVSLTFSLSNATIPFHESRWWIDIHDTVPHHNRSSSGIFDVLFLFNGKKLIKSGFSDVQRRWCFCILVKMSSLEQVLMLVCVTTDLDGLFVTVFEVWLLCLVYSFFITCNYNCLTFNYLLLPNASFNKGRWLKGLSRQCGGLVDLLLVVSTNVRPLDNILWYLLII